MMIFCQFYSEREKAREGDRREKRGQTERERENTPARAIVEKEQY